MARIVAVVVLQRRRRHVPDNIPAVLEGQTPDGSLIRVDVATGRRVLLFMTSSCPPCRAVWEGLGPGSREIVITPNPSTENRRAVAALAAEGVLVVMSSPVWFAFAPGPAPWRVVLEDGQVRSSGPAVGPVGPAVGPVGPVVEPVGPVGPVT